MDIKASFVRCTIQTSLEFLRASLFSDKTAIIDENGTFTYAELTFASAIIASALLNKDPIAFSLHQALITPPFNGKYGALGK
jgi:hypothetical protein